MSRLLYTDHCSLKTVRVGCPAHNCGGRCLLVAHVENGRITRLDADDRPECAVSDSAARSNV